VLAGLSDELLVAVEEDGLDRGGADVDSEIHAIALVPAGSAVS
jgi:hypothetical protein